MGNGDTSMEQRPEGVCRNCGAPLSGLWCGGCGQRRAEPLDMVRVLRDAATHVLELDGALWTTLRDLTLRPGRAAVEYLEGARRRLINPLKYLFWMTTISVVFPHLIGVDPLQQLVSGQDLSGFPEGTVEALQVFASLQAYVVFVIIFPLAFTLQLLFPRGYNMAEYYVVLALLLAHGGWITLLQHLLVLSPLAELAPWAPVPLLIYLVWAFTQIHGPRISVFLRTLAFIAVGIIINIYFVNTGMLIVMRHVLGAI